jgi:protein disulfide-isomerase-like protein
MIRHLSVLLILVGQGLAADQPEAWHEVKGHVSGEAPTLAEVIQPLKVAKDLCERTEGCFALTMERAPSDPDEMVLIYLKGNDSVWSPPSDWTTWVYSGGVSRKADRPREFINLPFGIRFPIRSADSPGFLSQRIESEPEPEGDEMYTGAVRNLVGSNLVSVALDPNKDVMVNMFAPWCGHCTRFKPAYGQLAHNLRHVKSLVFAQMDATRNTVRELSIRGYPTILFFPAHTKESLDYEGPRKPEIMAEWLQYQAGIKFDLTPPEESEDVFFLQRTNLHGDADL